MSLYRRLIAGCWFRHQETIWRENGLHCLTCESGIEVLPQKAVKGPAHHPEPVRGVPTIKAKKVRPDNVVRFEDRVSER
jgi:hypothetical protein